MYFPLVLDRLEQELFSNFVKSSNLVYPIALAFNKKTAFVDPQEL